LVTGCDKDEDLIKCCDESSGGYDPVKPNLVPHPKSPPNMGLGQGVVPLWVSLSHCPHSAFNGKSMWEGRCG
jgi:hypothetical protein